MTEDEAAEKVKERIIEMQSRLYDRAAAYTNLILIAGYASAFTIWNFTKSQLAPKTTIVIALFLCASLVVFVFFEVYKMAVNSVHFFKVSKVLQTATTPTDFLTKYKKTESEAQVINISYFRIWIFCLGFCVVTALIALGMLFYNFFVFVLPPWG